MVYVIGNIGLRLLSGGTFVSSTAQPSLASPSTCAG